MTTLRVSFVLLLMIFVVSSLALAQQYTVTDLGTLGGVSSLATAVNNEGHVAGAADLKEKVAVTTD
jgi:hypothetical protein